MAKHYIVVQICPNEVEGATSSAHVNVTGGAPRHATWHDVTAVEVPRDSIESHRTVRTSYVRGPLQKHKAQSGPYH